MTPAPKVGDFVFWEYSPGFGPMTFLGGVVTGVHPSGRVRVKGHEGFSYLPTHVTDAAAGEAILVRLRLAEERRDHAVETANSAFRATRDGLFEGVRKISWTG